MRYSKRKAIFRILIFMLALTSFAVVRATYIPTNRDTKEDPEVVTEFIDEPTDMTYLTENENFTFYFRDSRDTLAIYDKRNDYTWLTGTDLEFSKDIDDVCDETLDLYEEQFYGVDPLVFGNYVLTVPTDNLTTYVVDNSELVVDAQGAVLTDPADSINLSLDGLSIVNNQMYQLSFTVSAREERKMQLVLDNSLDTYVNLTTQETELTYVFTGVGNNPNATLEFQLGAIDDEFVDAKVTFDNIMLEEWDPNVLDEDGVTVIGGVVANTNQIARGDFELLDSELTLHDADLLEACPPVESRLNTTYTGFANSLITVEYYDDANNIKRISSASHKNVESELKMVDNDETHYLLEIDFKKEDMEVSVHIYLDENGVRYVVEDEDVIDESDKYTFAAIIISPFMGASGGAYEEFDLEELDYSDEEIFKYKVPGYTLVPDGSGTLIRFNDNDVKLEPYKGAVYGNDLGQEDEFYNIGTFYVPHKTASMPVFGIAHGNNQNAFVAYATEGDEHMQIISMPEDNLTYYNFTYPRFEYNKQYLQVYNKQGWGFLTYYEDRNHFDIDIRYDFLAGDGSTGPSADYIGMAKRYRTFLLENDLLEEKMYEYSDIPLRLDFLMSDSEKSIAGYVDQVTTTTDGLDTILEDIMSNNITNINVGMLGWNDGGVTLGDPRDADFLRAIGTKRDFENLIRKYQEVGVDISFEDDYYTIYEEVMNLRRNAARHTSGWYAFTDHYKGPIDRDYYARPVKSVDWMEDHTNLFNKLGVSSYSISGITNNLITDQTEGLNRRDSMNIFTEAFSNLDDSKLINGYQPNMYLWAYMDRYIGTPVYGTQFLIETDTVPFLQLVLHNTMELYGPYQNFSFYTQSDILRMIDYNIYPNFVLTENPAHLLTDTNSKDYYSTEYQLYEDLIQSIYGSVNTALSPVIGADWIDREVLENGVIRNTYDNGVEIIINYKDETYDYEGTTIPALSYEVVGE